MVDGDSAVGLWGDPERAAWIPFVDDLRTSGFRLVHPACFAEERGIEALIGVIHEHDLKVRKETWDLIHEVERLRRPAT
jgi:hypothetical protein